MKFGRIVQTWDSLRQAKFGKNRLRGYTFFGKIIPKINNFGYFGGCKPTCFKATTVKFGRRVRTWDPLPKAKICKKIA